MWCRNPLKRLTREEMVITKRPLKPAKVAVNSGVCKEMMSACRKVGINVIKAELFHHVLHGRGVLN